LTASRPCPCGSGRPSYPLYDARRIYCCRVCTKCERERRAEFRPEIFSGYTQADVNEPIEPEDA
jgi:hypothetical protein